MHELSNPYPIAKTLDEYRYTERNLDLVTPPTQIAFVEDELGIVHGVYPSVEISGVQYWAFQCAFIGMPVPATHPGPTTCLYCIVFTK